MEIRLRVAVAVLARRELAEVAGGDGADGVEEAEDDAACGHAVNLNVELEDRRSERMRDGEEHALALAAGWYMMMMRG